MSTNYYIADLHLGHAKIIQMCSRPFSDEDEMDQALIQNWNSAVTESDNVYIAGDFCLNNRKKAADYLHQLNGRKHLILGNHDRGITKDPEAVKCFESIDQMLTVKDSGKKIFICHYPVAEWPGYYQGYLHFYGHIHNSGNEAHRIMSRLEGSYNIGADLTGFTPRTLEFIMGQGRGV